MKPFFQFYLLLIEKLIQDLDLTLIKVFYFFDLEDEVNRLGFNSLKTTKPLQGDRLLTIKSFEFLVLIRLTSLEPITELTLEPYYLHYL